MMPRLVMIPAMVSKGTARKLILLDIKHLAVLVHKHHNDKHDNP